jgi:hypothetical protein
MMSIKAKDDCYRLIQQIAIAQDPVCIWAGCMEDSCVGHHLFMRDRKGTAFHPEAVRGLCHMHHGYAHARPEQFRKIMIGFIGERYYDLQRLSKTVVKNMDYVAKREELRGGQENFGKKAVNF